MLSDFFSLLFLLEVLKVLGFLGGKRYFKCCSCHLKCLSFLLRRVCPMLSDQAGVRSCNFGSLLFLFYLISYEAFSDLDVKLLLAEKKQFSW